MTSRELLEKAVHRSAIIHQPHALKAYLSAQFLAAHLGQPEALWQIRGCIAFLFAAARLFWP